MENAVHLLTCGFSVIPANADKTPALAAWRPYQKEPMTEAVARQSFRNGHRLAVVCGAVSGNLECLDFDQPGLYQPFMSILVERAPHLADRLVKRRTPSGGYHLLLIAAGKLYRATASWRCPLTDIKPESQTRGEGGYFLTAPSPDYTVVEHNLEDALVVSADERDLILCIARSFSETPKPCPAAKGNRPGDDYNRRADDLLWRDLLEPRGWTFTGRVTDGGEHLTRPGKRTGTSATLKQGCLYVFSTNAGLPLGPHSAFSAYAYLVHGGDFTAAARTLAGDGYGALFDLVSQDVPSWESPPPVWPVLAPKALPGIVGEFVGLATERSEADPAAVLATFLVRFGVEVGGGPYLMVGDTADRCRLAAVIVGETAKARKGTKRQTGQQAV